MIKEDLSRNKRRAFCSQTNSRSHHGAMKGRKEEDRSQIKVSPSKRATICTGSDDLALMTVFS